MFRWRSVWGRTEVTLLGNLVHSLRRRRRNRPGLPWLHPEGTVPCTAFPPQSESKEVRLLFPGWISRSIASHWQPVCQLLSLLSLLSPSWILLWLSRWLSRIRIALYTRLSESWSTQDQPGKFHFDSHSPIAVCIITLGIKLDNGQIRIRKDKRIKIGNAGNLARQKSLKIAVGPFERRLETIIRKIE